MGETRNSLQGWFEIIKQSGELHRKREAQLIKEKADLMRHIFSKRKAKVEGKREIAWFGHKPYLTTSAPAEFINDDKALASVYDEMIRRWAWSKDFTEFLKRMGIDEIQRRSEGKNTRHS